VPANTLHSILYSNPTKHESWIEIPQGLKDKELDISLYSIDGRLISTETHPLDSETKFKVNTTNLKAGLYIAVVNCNSFSDSHKLLITD
jgi:hypothetical protein